MEKTSKYTPDPRLELEKLNAFVDAQRAPLISAIQDLERREAEAKLANEEKRLAELATEIEPMAKYIVDIAEKVDAKIEEVRRLLIERQQVADDIAAKSSVFPDRRIDSREWHYSHGYEQGLQGPNGLLRHFRLQGGSTKGRSFADQDRQTLNRWLPATKSKVAAA